MTHEVDLIKRVVKRLDLPDGQWLISGSAIMFLNGIDRKKPLGDLDLYVSTRTWFEIALGSKAQLVNEPTHEQWRIWTTDPYDPKRQFDPPYLTVIIEGLEVNLFFNWRDRDIGNADPHKLMAEAELVQGLPCYTLETLLKWKIEMNREKDGEDIRLIKEHLKETGVREAEHAFRQLAEDLNDYVQCSSDCESFAGYVCNCGAERTQQQLVILNAMFPA